MTSCSSCGSPIRDGYTSCSMCYGDMFHGADNYYEEYVRRQEQEEQEREQARQEYYQEQESK